MSDLDPLALRMVAARRQQAAEDMAKDAMKLTRRTREFTASIINGGTFGAEARGIGEDAVALAVKAAALDGMTKIAAHLNQQVTGAAAALSESVIERIAANLRRFHPTAERVVIAPNPDSGRTEPVLVLDDRPGTLYREGHEASELFSLDPADARDRHGTQLLDDIALLGLTLPLHGAHPVTVPGCARPCSAADYPGEGFEHGWAVELPVH